jgi:putative protein-disulfide isomerase
MLSQVEITYYTDPLCAWSWAFEAPWRCLRARFGGQIAWHYCMGGLITDWQSYNDPLNTVTRPGQMAPHWFEVRQLSGMPFDEGLWHGDPPASSYPACLAFKAAEQQGPEVAERYLRRLREAAMLERRNIARRDVLLALADEASGDAAPAANLDPARFRRDFDAPATLEALRDDLKDTSYRDIGRFPTLILRHIYGPALIVVGYRPYQALAEALAWLAPDLAPAGLPQDAIGYAALWESITVPEIATGLGLEPADAEERLRAGLEGGTLGQAWRGGTPVYGRPVPVEERA